MARTTECFWERFESQMSELRRLDELRGALDVERRAASGSLLGPAVNLFPSAVKLLLAGLDEDAARYFVAVKTLALRAVAAGDKWVYADPFGDLFAEYMGLRLAALSESAAGGAVEEDLRPRMQRVIRQLTETLPRPRPTEILARLGILACERHEWLSVLAVESEVDGSSKWAPICRSLIALGREKASNDEGESGCVALDECFGALTDVDVHGAAYPHWLGADDVVGLAQLLGVERHGVTDVCTNIRAIRWGWCVA